ncbi:hypothetical protein BRD00_00040 [Halobacteriales archaeon QS_8_69_26]|nr:MAG: hypothetical protein BRD00_00040 [Halobacteriales archaeon QS_8_69_26]
MGYACPVCGTPQADERHLADHLAVTAMTHGDDHEDWLDEHVPDWSEYGPSDLGPVVAGEAAETEYPQVFEDTTGHDHGPDRGETLEDHLASEGRRGPRGAGRGDLTGEQAGILAEAREMTRRMMGEASDREDGEEGEGDDPATGSTDGPDEEGAATGGSDGAEERDRGDDADDE